LRSHPSLNTRNSPKLIKVFFCSGAAEQGMLNSGAVQSVCPCLSVPPLVPLRFSVPQCAFRRRQCLVKRFACQIMESCQELTEFVQREAALRALYTSFREQQQSSNNLFWNVSCGDLRRVPLLFLTPRLGCVCKRN
jgi:hypothetical protein